MKKKYIIFFMNLFTSLCMLSVGFSSWTIVYNASAEAAGKIQASELINYSDYIQFDGSVKGFKYCSSCFLNDDLSYAEKGTCTALMKINLDNCKRRYYDYSSLKIEIEFKYSNECNYNLFDTSKANITHTITLNEGVVIDDVIYSQENNYKMSFILKDYLNSSTQPNIIDTLNVQIHFDLTDAQFAAAFPEMENMNFECNVRIEGVNYESK